MSTELSSRLLFALLRPAIHLAARFGVALPSLLKLVELAYFEELRSRHPRDMRAVAKALGMSLRTTAELSKRHRSLFMVREAELERARRITETLTTEGQNVGAIAAALELELPELEAQLQALQALGWVRRNGDTVSVSQLYRGFLDDTLDARLDGLHNQLDVLTEAVWNGFVDPPQEAIHTRTWVFHAEGAALQEMVKATVLRIRHDAVELEESAFSTGMGQRYGVTMSVTPMERP